MAFTGVALGSRARYGLRCRKARWNGKPMRVCFMWMNDRGGIGLKTEAEAGGGVYSERWK